MKIIGEIYKIRSYFDDKLQKNVNISFIETDELIKVNGTMIKLLPIISESSSNYKEGEKIELDGEIRFEYIITSKGNRSAAPIPVIRQCLSF
ncbi:hypothetical protein [Bacillus sp. AFS031507]|uniref:hypothetical protein n=1 Tax=Bacillus sp. AFS031507 TaxID=2033496 RepID=UPI000BFE4701|nr:hypothetical protein [Bacillus sp. AFS031507]PGY12960.1 hypothetical protein COE25_07220 [Bacillus sp. AFS031507]